MAFSNVFTRKKVIISTVIALLLIVVGVVASLVFYTRPAAVTVPQPVVDKTLFTIYAPSALPGSYKLDPDSFSHDEGVLLFALRDDGGKTMTIAEQTTPSGFDFTAFYSQQMSDTTKVEGAPYQSVIGKPKGSGAQGTMMSVRTDDTWVLVSSSSADKSDMEFVAKHFRKLDS